MCEPSLKAISGDIRANQHWHVSGSTKHSGAPTQSRLCPNIEGNNEGSDSEKCWSPGQRLMEAEAGERLNS